MIQDIQMHAGRSLALVLIAMVLAAGQLPAAEIKTDETHRVVLFAPLGPVLIDVKLEAASQSIRQVRDTYCETLFKGLDSDNSGKLETAERALLPVFRRGPRAPAAAAQSSEADDAMTLEALKKYVDDQLGPLFAVDIKAPRLDQSVRVDVFDRNGDGVLAVDEISNAAQNLARYDLDDDESLSVSELQPFPQTVRQAQREKATPAESGARVLLVDKTSIGNDIAALKKAYGGQADVPLERCGLKQSAAAFDLDGNKQLNGDELQRWLLEGAADIRLLARWQAPGTGRLPTLKTEFEPSKRVAVEKETTRRWDAKLDAVSLHLDVADNRFLAGESVRLLKTTQFSTSDRDKNKYLDEAEYASFGTAAPFDAVDLNHDKMITLSEIDNFFMRAGQLSQTRVVMTFSDEVISLFQLMDDDHTNRLSIRELKTLKERMTPLDRNGDGKFDPQDFASVFKLTLAFSIPEGLAFTPSATMMGTTGGVKRSLRQGPLWYQRMDRNRDGDISWREFLGPRARFDAVDTDHDDLISRDEAEAADKKAKAESTAAESAAAPQAP